MQNSRLQQFTKASLNEATVKIGGNFSAMCMSHPSVWLQSVGVQRAAANVSVCFFLQTVKIIWLNKSLA